MNTIEQYFNICTCSHGQWLADGSFVYLSNRSGMNQIWQQKGKDGEPKQITFFENRVWSLKVAPNGKDIFLTMDAGGNEQEQIFVIKEGKEPQNLTNNLKARYQFGGVTQDGNTLIYACNARNPQNFDICKMNIQTGEAEILLENQDSYNTPAALSPNGRYLLYNKLKGLSDNSLWVLDIETKQAENIDPNGSFAQYSNPEWLADSTGFYLTTDVNSEYAYLAFYGLADKKLTKLYAENWDIESLSLSKDGAHLAMLIDRDGYAALEIWNTKAGSFESIPTPPKSGAGYFKMSWNDKSQLLITVASGKRPANIWLLDLNQDEICPMTTTSLEGIKSDELAEPSLNHFQSFDGLTVPYWFYQAPGTPKGGAVVIEIHGGPEGQERPTFSAMIQYLAGHGFSIAAPNVRGSTGYGKTYTHLDDVEKRLDSVHDVEFLVKHLVESGMADPKKIAVMGGSYGGYMTLASITEYPDLWAAGVDTVGMSNLETFLENTSDYRRAHRESEYGTLANDRETLRAVSPIFKVDRIKAPLMVVHGANDPRVPVTEADQIVESLRERGIETKYLRYADEGHGLAKRKNQMDCYPKVAEFLKEHLGMKDS